MKNKYLLAIPAYNCALQISRVLNRISPNLERKLEKIVVINNCSTDNTEEVVLDYLRNKKSSKFHLFRNDENYSLGGSHKVAFLHAQKIGATHTIILHGDDQADAGEVFDLIRTVENGTASTVLGSRFNPNSHLQGYDWKRIAGNKVLNVLFTVMTSKRIEDLGSGLNIFAMQDLEEKRYLNFANRLTFNFELLLDLVDRQVDFSYCPISWREEDQVSNAKNFNVAFTGIKNVFNWKFNKKRFFKTGEEARNYTAREIV